MELSAFRFFTTKKTEKSITVGTLSDSFRKAWGSPKEILGKSEDYKSGHDVGILQKQR